MDIIHHLQDQRSPAKQAQIFWGLGGICLVIGLTLFSGILGWVVKGMGILSGLIGAAYYFNRSKNEVLLSENTLVTRNQAGEKTILFAEIQKAELSLVKDGKMQRLGLYNIEDWAEVNEKAVLHLSDGASKKLEVAAQDFALADFIDFLRTLQVYGQGNLLQETDRIKALVKENETYLQQDLKLKTNFEQGLLEAYKAVYVQRGNLYLKENPQAKILYQYDKNPNNVLYFIDQDYLPQLNGEGLQNAKLLLAGAEKGIELVDTRIKSFQEIANKLKQMQESNLRKLELRKAVGKVEKLAMENDLTALNDLDRNELLLQMETIKQLETLSTNLNGLDDLDKAKSLQIQLANLKM